MGYIRIKWGKQTLTVSETFLASIEDMSLSHDYDTDKKKATPRELKLPVVFYKELDSSGRLDISDKIATLNALIGKSAALYVNSKRLFNAFQWRLISYEVSEINDTMGVLDSARVECTFRAKAWPKGAYAKWKKSLKKAATKKTTKKTTKKSKKKTNSQIATEVIAGKWGKGAAAIKKKLTAAGYNYTAVMKIVNARKKK